MKDDRDDTTAAKRRDFLKLTGAGVAGGAATAAATGIAPAAAAEEHAPTTGYRLTDHVRRAYETARF